MPIIEEPAFQYGQPDWDSDYLKWGFHDLDTQLTEAESAARLMPGQPLKILDIACGLGTHAIRWSQIGHHVTGIDISETFLTRAKERANAAQVNPTFLLADIHALPEIGLFDVITWIERPFFDQASAAAIAAHLTDGGRLITDVRNPEHPRMKARTGDWRTWREESGIYHLERHETDKTTGQRNSDWIEIDTNTGTIKKKTDTCKPTTLTEMRQTLENVGLKNTELLTLTGHPFTGGPEDYWLWLTAQK